MTLQESLEPFTAPVTGKTRRTLDTYRTAIDPNTWTLEQHFNYFKHLIIDTKETV